MGASEERAQAIASGIQAIGNALELRAESNGEISRAEAAIGGLLDAGWTPPAQRNEELRQTAEWQRDARRAFEQIEGMAGELDRMWHPVAGRIADRIRDALGERFRTPEKTS